MLTLAFIGFGVSTREYHIPYLEARSEFRIKYVFRRQEDIAQCAAYEPYYPELRFTTDLAEILGDPDVDLVVVCAPDRFHVEYARAVLNSGKHCLVEKPFAQTAQEAREVFALAKDRGLVCMANQNRRFDANILAVRDVLASGKLGRLVRYECHYDYFRPQGWYDHLGTLYNLAVHHVDQVVSLFGIPDRTRFDVRSIQHPGIGDDYYDMDFIYGNMKASVSTSMCVLIDYPAYTLHGTNGSFTLPPAIHNSTKTKAVGRHHVSFADAPEDRWGTLVYMKAGQPISEKVAVGCAHYERIYDNLTDVIGRGGEKCVKDEETLCVLHALEEATRVAASYGGGQ
jgi:predicted dehydrogenase